MAQHFRQDLIKAVATLAQGMVVDRVQSLAGWDIGPVRMSGLTSGAVVHAVFDPPPEIPLPAAETGCNADQGSR